MKAFHELLGGLLDDLLVEVRGAGDDLALEPLLVRLLAQGVDVVRVGGVETQDVRVLREHRCHHRREVGGRGIEEDSVEDIDPVRLEGREVGRHRGPAQCVVLCADHCGLQIGHLLGEPPYAGNVVDGVNFAGRDQRRRVRRQIARQQGGHQHPRLVGDRLHRRPGIAAQHHDELDVVLENELRGAGARLLRRVFVVVGDELEGVGVVPDLHAAGGVHILGQISHPYRPGSPQAATSPVRGARNPIFTVLVAAAAVEGTRPPAKAAPAAVAPRKVRLPILF